MFVYVCVLHALGCPLLTCGWGFFLEGFFNEDSFNEDGLDGDRQGDIAPTMPYSRSLFPIVVVLRPIHPYEAFFFLRIMHFGD